MKNLYIIIILVTIGCQNREHVNPLDDETNLDPDEWAPSELFAELINIDAIQLTWKDNSSFESGFIIERSVNNEDFNEIAVVDSNTTQFLDNNLNYESIYKYRLKGFTEFHESSYNVSDLITVIIQAPSKLEAVPTGNSMIKLNWIDNSNMETGFKIERSDNSSDFILISEVSANVVDYTDTGLSYESDKTYEYRLRAFTNDYLSDYSNDVYIDFVYEGPVWHVSISGSNEYIGSEALPFSTIQIGIDAASDGDTVLVYPGNYSEEINYNGKNIVIGSLILINGDQSYISQTVVDGNGNDIVKTEDSESGAAELVGFSLINGHNGIWCRNSYLTLNNLIISGMSIGIMAHYNSNIDIYNSEIYNNQIGVYVLPSAHLNGTNMNIHHNINDSDGGAGIYIMSAYSATATISNSIIHNNTGTLSGAIRNGGQLWLTNVTITDNIGTIDGSSGGIWQKSPEIQNSGEEAIIHMRNCILYGNTPAENYNVQNNNGFYPTCWDLDYNNIEVLSLPSSCDYNIGNNNQYNIDPLFCDPLNGDYTLKANSPCIGSGENGSDIGKYGIGCN